MSCGQEQGCWKNIIPLAVRARSPTSPTRLLEIPHPCQQLYFADLLIECLFIWLTLSRTGLASNYVDQPRSQANVGR